MYTSGSAIIPVEIKAGETVNDDFFKGFSYFDEHISKNAQLKILIYGGGRKEKRSGITLCNVRHIASIISGYEKMG